MRIRGMRGLAAPALLAASLDRPKPLEPDTDHLSRAVQSGVVVPLVVVLGLRASGGVG